MRTLRSIGPHQLSLSFCTQCCIASAIQQPHIAALLYIAALPHIAAALQHAPDASSSSLRLLVPSPRGSLSGSMKGWFTTLRNCMIRLSSRRHALPSPTICLAPAELLVTLDSSADSASWLRSSSLQGRAMLGHKGQAHGMKLLQQHERTGSAGGR